MTLRIIPLDQLVMNFALMRRAAVKERVVWVDTKRTKVRSRSGKLKEKEVSVLEVRVKAQLPGQAKCREVLYSTESHTDRSYCRSGISFRPWTRTPAGEEILLELELTLHTPGILIHIPDHSQLEDHKVQFNRYDYAEFYFKPVLLFCLVFSLAVENEPVELTLALDTQSHTTEEKTEEQTAAE